MAMRTEAALQAEAFVAAAILGPQKQIKVSDDGIVTSTQTNNAYKSYNHKFKKSLNVCINQSRDKNYIFANGACVGLPVGV